MGLDVLNTNAIRVVAYLLGAVLSGSAAVDVARSSGNRRLLASWALLAVLMTGLGLARVIDFGPWLTALGRDQAQLEGWYDERREFQFWLVWGVVAATAAAALLLLLTLPRQTWPALPASLVAAGILGFVLVRAISFHDVDALLYRHGYHGLLLGTACELGLLLVFSACVGLGGRFRTAGVARQCR